MEQACFGLIFSAARAIENDSQSRWQAAKTWIPAIRDRIAQHVLKARLEPRLEGIFSASSYGYRPGRNAHQAIEAVKASNRKFDWVIDLDISKFFDEIDHELLMKAVETVVHEKWLLMYLRRILEAPEVDEKGNEQSRQGRGTPQGGVISPLLANLFLHYALDRWLEIHYRQISFVRYADDAVIHCSSLQEAQMLMQAIDERMTAVKLRLNQSKRKIAYCKDYKRRGKHEHTTFKFPGFLFRPGTFRKTGGHAYQSFMPDISSENRTKIRASIRKEIHWHNTSQTLENIAGKLNSKIRGWYSYFACYGMVSLQATMYCLQEKIATWLCRKHKTRSRVKGWQRLIEYMKTCPKLFYHWETGNVLSIKQ